MVTGVATGSILAPVLIRPGHHPGVTSDPGGEEKHDMSTRLRTTWLAGAGAAFLVMALSGAVMGASLLTAFGPTSEEEFDPIAEVDTTRTFEDVDGDGVDDDCDSEVVPDPDAEAAATAAVDLDGDGVVSVAEAAQSARIGGPNCNHGGYVSFVAGEADETDDADETEPAETTECEEVPAPAFDPAVLDTPGGFGSYVSSVAQSDAVGGKNCNHGGAVSAAVKVAKDAAAVLRQAAKAERAAERAASAEERAAQRSEQRAAARAERDAKKADRAAAKAKHGKPAHAGQGNGKGRGGD